MMATDKNRGLGQPELVQALTQPSAYPDDVASGTVEVVQTHISWVFLAGDYAYKVKKPVRNDFIDYSTLQRRYRFCLEELRLDRRYAPDIYLAVVPISAVGNSLQVESSGEIVEYAVKMRRFPADALLSSRLASNQASSAEIRALAQQLASFHSVALSAGSNTPFGTPDDVLRDALDNLTEPGAGTGDSESDLRLVRELREWTNETFQATRDQLLARREGGWIRECHGDLHAGNIVLWKGKLAPFDGIEFNERFRWIDVLSDVAFLAMDLIAREHAEHSSLLVSSYLERTGDYTSLELLRWYMVYRALVRAKVAGMRRAQTPGQDDQQQLATAERSRFLALARCLSHRSPPKLWITHGVSGSGKSTGAEMLVQREGAIRIRSDVERKRLIGRASQYRPSAEEQQQIYSHDATRRTYDRLSQLAAGILRAGYGVVVDATFLKREQRDQFARLARTAGCPFQILDFQADLPTLQQRILVRRSFNAGASDADLQVLKLQLQNQEMLDDSERRQAKTIQPD